MEPPVELHLYAAGLRSLRELVEARPAELDALIDAHPAVRESSCVGYPDERLGERVCAVVALRPGASLTLDELIAHLREREIATFKLPEKLRFIDALPRNALGKVQRRSLAELAAS